MDRVNGDTDVDAEAYLEALADGELDRQIESYEASLVREIQRGRRSEELLLRRLEPAMFATAFRVLRNRDSAEEARQEALLRLSRFIGKLRQPERIKSYAHQIIERVAYTTSTRRSRHIAVHDPAVDPESTAIEFKEPPELAVARAIVTLAEIHRTVLFLTSLGYTATDISKAVGVPVGTVTQRIFTARWRLREILGDDAE